MSSKASSVVKQFYAVMLTSAQIKSPRFLQIYTMPPKEDEVRKLISEHVIGKMEPSPHMYGNNPEVHLVPIHIPLDILYS